MTNDDWFEPPKIKLNFESCYNYEKLKSEGYISPTEVPAELLEVPTSVETPKVDTDAKISLHEKLYRFATKNGNTLILGGSENVI